MNKKLKQWSGKLFVMLLIVGMVGGIVLPDQLLSYAERRKLSQFPAFSWDSIWDNDYSDSLETYLLDQFPGRDLFRTIKTDFDIRFLGKTDSNGYVKIGNHLFEIKLSYDESQVNQAAALFQEIASTYFEDANVYYSIIPDKNYFVESLPRYDYEQVSEIMKEILTLGTEIDIWDTLELDDFYETDLHAKQEALIPLANALLASMGLEDYMTDASDYEQLLATDSFYGGYSSNSAFLAQPDMLYYLTNDMIKDAIVYDYESDAYIPVYNLEKLEGMDGYDIFLDGARALLTIQNPNVDNGKKLIIFRDSFGSSISPLLLSGYEEITLVDLRYVSPSYAMQLLQGDSEEAVEYDDVLFLYQVQLLYNSNSMKTN